MCFRWSLMYGIELTNDRTGAKEYDEMRTLNEREREKKMFISKEAEVAAEKKREKNSKLEIIHMNEKNDELYIFFG